MIKFDDEGFALESGLVTVFTTNKDGFFLEKKQEFVSEGGSLAEGSYLDKAPEEKDGFIIKRVDNKWIHIESHIGTMVYNKQTKEPHKIKEYGPISTEFTTLEPGEFSKWDGKKWIDDAELIAQALQQKKTDSIKNIDDLVGQIYLKFTRFDKEYLRREQQAKEFKANSYKGKIPLQVNAFAVNTGIPARQATDIILSQATKLNQALDILGELRMKKYQINKQETIEDVKAVTEQLMKEIQQVSEQL